MMAEKSAAVPFLPKPAALTGTLPGDVGFDPLGLSNNFDLKWMREAELKHGRLAMLATVGAPAFQDYSVALCSSHEGARGTRRLCCG